MIFSDSTLGLGKSKSGKKHTPQAEINEMLTRYGYKLEHQCIYGGGEAQDLASEAEKYLLELAKKNGMPHQTQSEIDALSYRGTGIFIWNLNDVYGKASKRAKHSILPNITPMQHGKVKRLCEVMKKVQAGHHHWSWKCQNVERDRSVQ